MKSSFRTLAALIFSAIAGAGMFVQHAVAGDDAPPNEFKPIKEAEMPRGFPKESQIGVVEVKEYPAYRKATASGVAAFWTLFGHIQGNKIAMSAPVEMDYGDAKAKKPSEQSMSFLYGSPDIGKTGTNGSVNVSDVAATKVVSIGCRGPRTEAAIETARKELLHYLNDNRSKYEIYGPLRVMGYNSPFVPKDKNFFEVQIPVKTVTADHN